MSLSDRDFRLSNRRPEGRLVGNSSEVKLWIKTAGMPASRPWSAFCGRGGATPDYTLIRKALSACNCVRAANFWGVGERFGFAGRRPIKGLYLSPKLF